MAKVALRTALLVFFCMAPSAGCHLQARYAYSEPRLDRDQLIRMENGRIFLEDIELWFLAWNRRGSGLLLFPMIWPIDASDEFKPPFRVTMELVPHRSGFALDWRKIFLVLPSKGRVPVTRILAGHVLKGNGVAARIRKRLRSFSTSKRMRKR